MMKILTNVRSSKKPMQRKRRGHSGNTIAEMPSFLWFLTIFVAVPMVCIVTLGIRGVFFLFACRDATNKAAKCASFTNNNTTVTPNTVSAINTASAAFASDMKAWNGISGTLTLSIIGKSNTGGADDGPYTASPTTIDQSGHVYFIRGTGKGSITPLLPVGNWDGLSIPGLTTAFPLNVVVESYVENPTGLTN